MSVNDRTGGRRLGLGITIAAIVAALVVIGALTDGFGLYAREEAPQVPPSTNSGTAQ